MDFFNTSKQSQPSGPPGSVRAYLGGPEVVAVPWLNKDGHQYARVNGPGGGLTLLREVSGVHPADVQILFTVDRVRSYGGNKHEPTVVGRSLEVFAHDKRPVLTEDKRPKFVWTEFYRRDHNHAGRKGFTLAEFPYTQGTQTMCNEVVLGTGGRVNALLFEGAVFASPEDMLEHQALTEKNRAAWEKRILMKDEGEREKALAERVANIVTSANQMARDQRKAGNAS